MTSGVTGHGIKWAFTYSHAHNWHPLTTISHQLDCQLYGQNPRGHHFTNVVLHNTAVILLFLLLLKMTGGPSSPLDESVSPRRPDRTGTIWRSAFVAAVFAIHPLHVESVAWVAERKDVLSAVFFMLTLAAYVHYTRKPTLGRYAAMVVLFGCGLMSKPMLVTVPFVLVLLDYWPLKRVVDFRTLRQFILEKVPLLPLSLASCLATMSAQREAVGLMAQLPLSWRISNAVVGYITYITETFWPVKLAVFYPHPQDRLPRWEIFLAVALLTGISAIVVGLRKSRPYIVTGWFWYLGMLVPVIGVFQIGMQSHADRYTYLPQIGLVIAFTWGVGDLSARWRHRKSVLTITSIVIIAALVGCAWKQTSYWKNSGTLWTHALAVTSDNVLARNGLGQFYAQGNRLGAAIAQYEAALKIATADTGAYKAITPLLHYNLGNALLQNAQLDEAIAHYEKAVQLQPDFVDAHFNFGAVLFQKGQLEAASAQWRRTLSIQPDYAEAHTGLGNAALRKGSLREGIDHYEKAIASPRPSLSALNNLAWILSTCPDASIRNGGRGLELARRAVQFSRGKNSTFLCTLAAAYAETERFSEAVEAANRALQLAKSEGQQGLATRIEQDIDLYRANTPLRNAGPTRAHQSP